MSLCFHVMSPVVSKKYTAVLFTVILTAASITETGKHLSYLAHIKHGQQWLQFSRSPLSICCNILFDATVSVTCTGWQNSNNDLDDMLVKMNASHISICTSTCNIHALWKSAFGLSNRPFQRLSWGSGGRIHNQWHVPPEAWQREQTHAGLVWPETRPWWMDCYSETPGWLCQLL